MNERTRRAAIAHAAGSGLLVLGFVLAAAGASAYDAGPSDAEPVTRRYESYDPILQGDPIDPSTGWAAFILPGVPWIEAGPDGLLGTEDDRIDPETIGDIDIIVETEVDGVPPVGICEPFGRGVSIPFTVRPSDGKGVAATAPDYFEGLPLLGIAFADLDGDGFIGVTRLDGDASDDRLEAAELRPVGRRYAQPASDGRAVGELVVTTGGPPGHELRIAIAAVGYAGPLSPDYLGGRVPEGPAIATRLPFLPMTDPYDAIPLDTVEVLAADPDGRVAVQARIALDPDPTHPILGELFTLRLDGSDPTIGLALARSGPAARFGVAVEPDRATYLPLDSRPLRLAVDDAGNMMPVEIARRVTVADDGDASQTKIRIVALDRLGNVTAPDRPERIRLKTDKGFRIVSPDEDEKERYEEITIADARGVEIVLDDLDEELDNESAGRLIIRSEGRVERIDLASPDADVDESGRVTGEDLLAFEDCIGLRDGDPAFVPQLDLDSNGELNEGDLEIVLRDLGRKSKKDGRSKIRGRDGACFDGKKRKPDVVTELPPPPCSDAFTELKEDEISWTFSNGSATATIETFRLVFPPAFGAIKDVKLDGHIFKANESDAFPDGVPSGGVIGPDHWTQSEVAKRQLDPGESRTVEVKFTAKEKNASQGDFGLTVTFEEGCMVGF